MRLLSLVWLFSVACGWAAEQAAPPPAGLPAEANMGGSRSDVTVQQFIEAHPSGLTVLDVRTPGEFASGHVPGAVPVPLDQLGPAHPAVVGLDKSKPVYVICEVGGRSSRAADMLAAAGYTTINVQGGTAAWIQAGQAVE